MYIVMHHDGGVIIYYIINSRNSNIVALMCKLTLGLTDKRI